MLVLGVLNGKVLEDGERRDKGEGFMTRRRQTPSSRLAGVVQAV
jgi:hypothetical protein